MTLLFPRHAPLAIMLASLAILGTALASQYWGGLLPCELCVWQRWAYVAVIGIAFAALQARDRWRAGLTGLAALACLVGGAIAVFHVGVEQHWWAGLATCTGSTGANSVEALKAQILAAPVTRCDEVAWSLFGVSMAGWNVLASALLAGFGCLSARLLWRAA